MRVRSFFLFFLETGVKRACADVTLKIVDDDDISGFLLWSRESNILSLSEVGSTRP